MEIAETVSETSQPADSGAASESAPASAFAVLLSALSAMILIYIVTVFLPKIAAAVDKLLGREKKEISLPNAEEYKVRDIYEGEDGEDK